MNGRPRIMVVSPLWLQVAILTFLVGFVVLGILAYLVTAEHPPIPQRVLRPDGTLLFTGDDIMGGQHLFQK
jgi:nitric oxide reductase subunit B